jgi:hypothetical protein
MSLYGTKYSSLADFRCGDDYAGNMACLLLEKAGSIFGKVNLRLSAKDQRRLFGRFIGKGVIVIDGENEEVHHMKQVCFGTMYDTDASYSWRDLMFKKAA